MEDKIMKADLKYRRNIIIGYLLGIIAVWLGFTFLKPVVMQAWAAKEVDLLEVISIAFMLLFCVPATYLMLLGFRIVKYREMPCPGMKVFRDTKVIQGKSAILRGKTLIAFGIFAITMALLGSMVTHHFAQRLKQPIQIKIPVIHNTAYTPA